MTEVEASEQSTELDMRHAFQADREPADIRCLELPRLVEAQPGWHLAGLLDVWLRDDGLWWGRVRDDHDVYRWHRATALRPASTHPDRWGQRSEPDASAPESVPLTTDEPGDQYCPTPTPLMSKKPSSLADPSPVDNSQRRYD